MNIQSIYNKSIKEFANLFEDDISEKMQNTYSHFNNKKLTGYMLFVQDMYKELKTENITFSEKSKIISQKWKTIDKEKKNKYIMEAAKRSVKKPKIVKKKKVVETVPDKTRVTYDDSIIYNTKLKKIIYEDKFYIVDNFNNIIDTKTGHYIGLYQDGNVILYK